MAGRPHQRTSRKEADVALHLPIAILAALSLASGDRVGLYNGPLMGISHARLAHSSPDEAHSVVQLGLSEVYCEGTSYNFRKAEPECG